jgi:hypothetical protein
VSEEQKSASPERPPSSRRGGRPRGRPLFAQPRPRSTAEDLGEQIPPPPRLTRVIQAAYHTYQQAVDTAVRDLLAEVVIAMGVDQDLRTEISKEDAIQVLEALRYVREVRS